MVKFAPYALRAYMAFRNPKYFLLLLVSYIAGSVFAHSHFGYDADWGMTNLILSIEASTASAVLMMVAERTSDAQVQMTQTQREQIGALLAMAEQDRQLLAQQMTLLEEIRANDTALLDFLKAKPYNAPIATDGIVANGSS